MPVCTKCGTILKDTDRFCKECGAPSQSTIMKTISAVPTEADIPVLDKRLATDESFRIEYVKYRTGRTDVTSDDFWVQRIATNPEFRREYIYDVAYKNYLENTKCSELPLDWTRWPNLILIEDAYPATMTDCIASFIKRTKDFSREGSDRYMLYMVCMDPSKSWSVLQQGDHVQQYVDNPEDGALEVYGLYGYCKEELEFFAKNRINDIDEYFKYSSNKTYYRQVFFIDDYDLFTQKTDDYTLQQGVLPYIATYAKRTGIYLILGSKFGSRALGSLKSAFTIKSSSEFARMCKGEYSRGSSTNIVAGYDFEQLCADLLLKNRYKNVTVTKKSGDQGIDILAEKDGVKYAIQCKHYSSPVGNTAIQEAHSGKTYYGCHVAVVMTNSTFSDSAIQLASQLGVVLWDGDFISELQRE